MENILFILFIICSIIMLIFILYDLYMFCKVLGGNMNILYYIFNFKNIVKENEELLDKLYSINYICNDIIDKEFDAKDAINDIKHILLGVKRIS